MKPAKNTRLEDGAEDEDSGGGALTDVRREPGPAWVYTVGSTALVVGALVYLYLDDKASVPGFAALFVSAGGAFMTLIANFIYGESADRRNMLRWVLVLASYLCLLASFMIWVMFYVGFFEGSRAAWVLYGVGAGLLGGFGTYYGIRYQQSPEGRSIGRRLGFRDAEGGGQDGHYDSKGLMNGVEVLFDVAQRESSKNHPPKFTLEVLCRCGNREGIKLLVRPSGLFRSPLGALFGSLSRGGAVEVPGWDYYNAYCDRPDAALRLLSGVKRERNVFNEGAGFLTMSLDGGEFKFVFSKTGYIDESYVRLILQDVSRLAALLCK